MLTLRKIYNQTLQSAKNNRVIWLPFIIFAALEFIALIIIFLAPRMPLKVLLGPPIRALWGEQFLHYPVNFVLIPKLVSFARICLTVAAGSLLTGIATILVSRIYQKQRPVFKEALRIAVRKYISLFAIILIFSLLYYFLNKLPAKLLVKYFSAGHSKLLFLGPRFWIGPFLFCFNFGLVILIQSLFVYAIPALLIGGDPLAKAIIRSFLIFKKYFLKTILLVGLPMLIYIPISVLQANSGFLISRLFPEAVLWVAILSLLLSSLVIDFLITVTTTNLYLMDKNE